MNVLCLMTLNYPMHAHAKSTEIENWSIPSMKINYVKHNRKELPSNRLKLNSFGANVKVGIDNY